MPRHTLASLLVFGLALALPHTARGEAPIANGSNPTERAQASAAADQLFERGYSLLRANKLAEASDLLEESNRLRPNISTLVQLGRCRTKQQRFASAWSHFQEAAKLARFLDDPTAVKLVTRYADELTSKLSHLTILVPEPVPGLEVRRDNMLVGPIQYGEPIPLDPGDHAIAATAPGYKPLQMSPVTFGVNPENQSITIPALEPLPPPPPPPEPPKLAAPIAAPIPPPPPPPPPPLPASSSNPWPWVLGGAGTAAIVVGTVAEILAFTNDKHMERDCPSRVNCSNDVLLMQGRRDFEARLGYVALPIGIVALGGAATWMFLAGTPSKTEQPNKLNVGATATATGAALWIGGAL